MSARDFINETLLAWLEEEVLSEAKGNKHFIAGVEGAMKARRGSWSRTAANGMCPSDLDVREAISSRK